MERMRVAGGGPVALASIALALLWAPGAAAQDRIACGEFYEVRAGDTLRDIAVSAYGVGNYQLIFNANREILARPSLLLVGQRLFIPCLDGSGPRSRAEIEAAAGAPALPEAGVPAPDPAPAPDTVGTEPDPAGQTAAAEPELDAERDVVGAAAPGGESVPLPAAVEPPPQSVAIVAPAGRQPANPARQPIRNAEIVPHLPTGRTHPSAGATTRPVATAEPVADGPRTGGVQPAPGATNPGRAGAAATAAVPGIQPAAGVASGARVQPAPGASGGARSAASSAAPGIPGVQPGPGAAEAQPAAGAQAAGVQPPPASAGAGTREPRPAAGQPPAATARAGGTASVAPAVGGVQPAPDPAARARSAEAEATAAAAAEAAEARARETAEARAREAAERRAAQARAREAAEASALEPPTRERADSGIEPGTDAPVRSSAPRGDPPAAAGGGAAVAAVGQAPAAERRAQPAGASSVFGLPDGAGPVRATLPQGPRPQPGGVQPLPRILPNAPEPAPGSQESGGSIRSALARAPDAGSVDEPDAFAQPPIRILTGDYPPYSGADLPQSGMLTEIVVRALEQTAPGRQTRVSFVDEWGLHLSVLLPDGAYDIGLPWFRPDCSKMDLLSAGMRRRCTDFLWSQPLHEVVIGYFVRAGDPLETSLDYAELEERVICRPEGFYTFDLEQKGLGSGPVSLLRAATPQACVASLMAGEADVVAMSVTVVEGVLAEQGLFGQVAEIPALADILTLHALSARTNPLGRVYLTLINRGLRTLRESGEWFEVVARHLAAHSARTQ